MVIELPPREGNIPIGCPRLDGLLRGGFHSGEISLIYGEAATGKTTTVIQAATNAAKMGFKVLYVDSDHSFTQQRYQQIAKDNSKEISELIMLFLPETFAEQRKIIQSLENYVTPSLGLVIVDSISSLYRAAFSKADSIFSLNRDLSGQLAYLGELSSSSGLACMITSQVHAKLMPPFSYVEPVARRAVLHFPRMVIRIRNTPKSNVKEFSVERIEGSDVRANSSLVALKEGGLEDA
jgi:RecA/RadA recombinase